MAAPHNQVFFPATLPELFTAWGRFPDAVPFAGGTGLIKEQESRYLLTLPSNILALDRLDELHRITRTERYLEIGAMVKLNEIIHLGKIVPRCFTQALRGIAGPEVRNLATIGGNLCHAARRLDAAAPLIALDARYELRTALASRWISASRFSSLPGPLVMNPQELLTRIRIPLEPWNYAKYQKFRDDGGENGSRGSMVFIARLEKDILTDLRVVFAGESVLRDKNSEAVLSGKRLPLDRRDLNHFIELWRTCLSAVETPDLMTRGKMLNFIESCGMELTD
jgi:CO/xanthine dehydrogenase FAD-binding subunit